MLLNPALPAANVTRALRPAWLLTGTFVVTFDFFAINVVVPSLQAALGAAPAQLQWVVAAFGLLFGSGLIAGSRLGDRFGAARMFGLGMLVFALASLAAAAAPTLAALIAARAVQGLAAALLQPQILTLIGRIPEPAERQRVFAGYGAALGLGSALGQLVGAAVLEADLFGLGWRAVFLPQAVLALAVVLCAPLWRGAPPRGAALDLASAALLAAGTVLFMVPLIEGRGLGWPAWLLLPLLAAGALAAFWHRQHALVASGRAALVDPALLGQRRFVWAVATVLAFYATNASGFLIVTLTLRGPLAQAPLASAAVFSTMSIGFLITTFGARRASAWLGRSSPAIGAVALAAGHTLLAALLQAGAGIALLLPALFFTGAAMGLVMSPLIAQSVGVVDAARTSTAAGLVGTAQWLGNALGVAVLGSVYFAVASAADGRSATQGAVVGHVLLALLSAAVALMLGRWARRLSDTAAARR